MLHTATEQSGFFRLFFILFFCIFLNVSLFFLFVCVFVHFLKIILSTDKIKINFRITHESFDFYAVDVAKLVIKVIFYTVLKKSIFLFFISMKAVERLKYFRVYCFSELLQGHLDFKKKVNSIFMDLSRKKVSMQYLCKAELYFVI